MEYFWTFYAFFCIMQFIFFSVPFLAYREYKYPLFKVLILSATPFGWVVAILAGMTNSAKVSESKIHKMLREWLYVKKD